MFRRFAFIGLSMAMGAQPTTRPSGGNAGDVGPAESPGSLIASSQPPANFISLSRGRDRAPPTLIQSKGKRGGVFYVSDCTRKDFRNPSTSDRGMGGRSSFSSLSCRGRFCFNSGL